MTSIAVVVQAGEKDRECWSTTRASIEASDIGTNYQVIRNPPRRVPKAFFLDLLAECEKLSADYVLRLEDDALVNEHILHNITHWEALAEPDFGLGWLFVPGHYARHGDELRGTHDRMFRKRRGTRRFEGHLHGAVGVLMRRTDIPWLREGVAAWNARHADPAGFDISLTSTVDHTPSKALYLHHPPLVEHQPGKSTLGHRSAEGISTGGKFSRTFKRLVPSSSFTAGSVTGPKRAFLLASGTQERWGAAKPKQLYYYKGDTLIARLIRQTRALGYEPVVVTENADLAIECGYMKVPVLAATTTEFVTRTLLATREHWGEETLALVGDGYLTDADVDKLASSSGIRCIGRADEIYGFSFKAADREALALALQRVTWDALYNELHPPPPIQSRGKLFQLARVCAGLPIDPPRGFTQDGWPKPPGVWMDASPETRDFDVLPR